MIQVTISWTDPEDEIRARKLLNEIKANVGNYSYTVSVSAAPKHSKFLFILSACLYRQWTNCDAEVPT
jgi:hypothetical protein